MAQSGAKVSTFRERLSLLCEDSPMTDTEISTHLHVSKQTLSAWRSGTRSPKAPTIESIARYFRVSVDWLMGFDVAREAPEPAFDNVMPMPESVMLPLIGSIACGVPILAEENVEAYISVPSDIHGDFLLRCQGDSMKDARILDGDLVVIRRQDDVQDGQIAAVLLDDEATLKRVHHLPGGAVLLQPANAAYQPIVCGGPDEIRSIRILGLATHFISKVI